MSRKSLKRVLIVDHAPDSLRELCSILEDKGCQVSFATDSEEALSIAATDSPNIILLDSQLSDNNCYSACEKLKAMSETAHIPVIIVKDPNDGESAARSFDSGADDYLLKPLIESEVWSRVRTHLLLQTQLVSPPKLKKKKSTNEILRAEKLAWLADSVGEFTHEIGTPVGIGVTALSQLDLEAKQFEQIYKSGKLKKSDLERFLHMVFETAQIGAANLERAIDLILSFKNITVNQCNDRRDKFNVYDYLQQIILCLRPKIKNTQHNIRVICPRDLVINSYAGAFSHILTNLVANTLIHGFEGVDRGEIVITLDTNDKELIMIYKDNGVGIPLDLQNKIFDRYFTTKKEEGGTGQGLFILKQSVEKKLGGHVTLESEPGNGVCFTIKLPL